MPRFVRSELIDCCDHSTSDDGREALRRPVKERLQWKRNVTWSRQNHRVATPYENRVSFHETSRSADLRSNRPSINQTKFIDVHAHLDFLFTRLNYKKSFSEFKKECGDAFPPNFEGCVAVFCDPNTFQKVSTFFKLYISFLAICNR